MKEKDSEQLIECLVEIVTALRKKKGLSHEKLASMSGLTRGAIGHFEGRKRNPSLLLVLRISKALNIPFSKLMKEAESRLSKSKSH